MTRLRAFLAGALLPAVLPAGLCLAQVGKWEVALSPGYAWPTHHAGDFMKKSFNLQTVATYQFHEWFAAGAEFGMSTGHNLGGKLTEVDWDTPPDGRSDNVRFESSAKAYWINFTPLLKIGKWVEFEELLYRPYIATGMGLYHVWFKPGINKIDGYTTRQAHVSEQHVAQNSDSDTSFGVNIGIGIDQQVFERFTVGLDFRFHHVFNAADYDRDGEKDDDFDFLIPGLRFYYVF